MLAITRNAIEQVFQYDEQRGGQVAINNLDATCAHACRDVQIRCVSAKEIDSRQWGRRG